MKGNINIVFDTNSIKKINDIDYNLFEFNKTFLITDAFITGNNIENIHLYIPQICIEELLIQYAEEYKSCKDIVDKQFDELIVETSKLGWDLTISKNDDLNFNDYHKKMKLFSDEYIEKYQNLKIINNCSEKKFSEVINRAMFRKKPFFSGRYRQKDFSDAGFKDVIFLESIKEYFQNHNEEIIIITGDEMLLSINTFKEFNSEKVQILKFEKGDELKEYLCQKLDIVDLSEQYLFCKDQYFIENIEKVLNCKIINSAINIDKKEEDYIFYEVECLIERNESRENIYVRLDEVFNFDEILSKDTGESIHIW